MTQLFQGQADAEGVTAATGEGLKLFVSYSRADMAAADAMVEALEASGFDVRIDRRDLPYGEEWQAELSGFIAESDTVVWLVSPDSVKSKWCNWELGEVGRLSKRLVPVRLRDIDPGALPESLGKIHLLPAEGTYSAPAHEPDLVRTLNTDRAWLKQATGLGERAREWLQRGRDAGRLLRGTALSEAEAWSQTRPRGEAPAPASEILELILASRRAQDRRRRMTVAGSLAAAVVALALAATAVWFGFEARDQAAEADRQRVTAEQNEERAIEQERIALEREAAAIRNESQSLSALSRVALSEGRPVDAVKLALAAWPRRNAQERPALPQTRDALAAALPAMHQRLQLSASGPVGFSPDGRTLVARSQDGTMAMWDVPDGTLAGSFASRLTEVQQIAFAPDGRQVAFAGAEGVEVWNAQGRTLVFRLTKHEEVVYDISFSPDGSVIATASADGTARLWSASDARELAVLSGHRRGLLDLAFSPDGSRIATAGSDGTARLWDARSGELLLTLSGMLDSVGNPAPVYMVAFSPDGKHVVTAAAEKVARIWDSHTGEMAATLDGHEDLARLVAFSADGKLIATGSDDGTVRIWNAAGGTQQRVLQHGQRITAVAFTPDGGRLLSASWDGTARVWTVSNGDQFAVLSGHRGIIGAATFSPDGSLVATSSRDATVRVWRTDVVDDAIAIDGLDHASISDDGSRIVVRTEGANYRILDAVSGALVERLDGLDEVQNAIPSFDASQVALFSDPALDVWDSGRRYLSRMGDHHEGLQDAAFSPDGTRVATVSWEGSARVWNGTDGAGISLIPGDGGHVASVDFSPDGGTILALSDDRAARIFDAGSGAEIMVLAGHDDTVKHAAFSRDGRFVATASLDRTARIWDARTGEETVRLGHNSAVYWVGFSADGKLLLTRDHVAANVWDLDRGTRRAELRRHNWGVAAAAFSRDGSRVLTAGREGISRLWDAATGIELAAFVPRGDADDVRFVEGNTRFVTVSEELDFADGPTRNYVQIWSAVETLEGDAFQIACRRLGNDVSLDDVREHYGLGVLAPICGDNAPLPVDLSALR